MTERFRNNAVAVLITVLVWFLLMVASVPASAQTFTKSEIVNASILSGLQVADFRTTRLIVVRDGGTEQNPVMRGLVGHPVQFGAVKASVTVVTTLALRALRPKHPRLAKWAWVGVNLGQGFVVYHNVKQLRARR